MPASQETEIPVSKGASGCGAQPAQAECGESTRTVCCESTHPRSVAGRLHDPSATCLPNLLCPTEEITKLLVVEVVQLSPGEIGLPDRPFGVGRPVEAEERQRGPPIRNGAGSSPPFRANHPFHSAVGESPRWDLRLGGSWSGLLLHGGPHGCRSDFCFVPTTRGLLPDGLGLGSDPPDGYRRLGGAIAP